MNDKRKKDKKLFLLLIVTAIAGFVSICVNGNFELLLPYSGCMGISVPTLYFNYSLCKSENKWRSFWHDRDSSSYSGEPSDFRLITAKIAEWAVFILGCLLVLISFAL